MEDSKQYLSALIILITLYFSIHLVDYTFYDYKNNSYEGSIISIKQNKNYCSYSISVLKKHRFDFVSRIKPKTYIYSPYLIEERKCVNYGVGEKIIVWFDNDDVIMLESNIDFAKRVKRDGDLWLLWYFSLESYAQSFFS